MIGVQADKGGIMTKNIPPSIKETAFNCPYCGVLTTQYWMRLCSHEISDGFRRPFFVDENNKNKIMQDEKLDGAVKERWVKWVDKIASGSLFIEERSEGKYVHFDVLNLHISKCYECSKVAVWVHDKIVFPPEKGGVNPNNDLPEEVITDFEEARSILNLSPRGAAALLRLAIQKLCKHLGEKGQKIDDDIASMVSKGLNPLIQKSLDIVRVIGNEAVHPGVIDIKDDRDTANELFGLINLIADQMITNPKHVNELYDKLPAKKREAIQKRNEKAKK